MPTPEAPDLTEFQALTEVEELRKANSNLQSQLRRAKARVEDLVDATTAAALAAMVALGPVAPIAPPHPDKRSKSAEVALWDLGDWQGAKKTKDYNSAVMGERDSIPRSDNVDRMCYEFARTMLAGEERLTWDDCPEDIQRLEIGNYRALVIHGDEIGRNGYASPDTIAAWVTRQQSGAYPWAFRDCYTHHYHQHGERALPNGLGSLYFTGSTESENRYAGVSMAASAAPSQRLHFIDPDAGRVVSVHKIWLA